MRKINYILFILFIFSTGCSNCSRTKSRNVERDFTNTGRETIKMYEENGVYLIPVEVNDIPMQFIFDTGASVVSISQTEATFMWKQGSLTEDDIKGTTEMTNANGEISEGVIINLQKIKIGRKILRNIEAVVVNNQYAPLLLGQTVLSRFGKVSLDYKNKKLILE